jgi:hypothetical protein
MHNSYEHWKQEGLCSSHLGDLVLLFDCEGVGLSMEMTVSWLLGNACQPTSHCL